MDNTNRVGGEVRTGKRFHFLGSDIHMVNGITAVLNASHKVVGSVIPAAIAFSGTHSMFFAVMVGGLQKYAEFALNTPAGVLVDRFGARRLLQVILPVHALVMVLFAQGFAAGSAKGFLTIASILALGMFNVAEQSAVNQLLRDLSSVKDVVRSQALVQSTYLLLSTLVPVSGLALWKKGHEFPFLVNAGLIVLMMIPLFLGFPRSGASEKHEIKAVERKSMVREAWEGFAVVAKHRQLSVLALLMFFQGISVTATFGSNLMAVYSSNHLHIDLGSFVIVTAGGSVVGWFATRYTPVLQRMGTPALLRLMTISVITVQAGLFITESVKVAIALQLLAGAQAAVWGVLAAALPQQLAPEGTTARVSSVIKLLGQLAAIVGPFAGLGFATLYGVTAPFGVGALLSVLLLVIFWIPVRRFATVTVSTGFTLRKEETPSDAVSSVEQ